VGRRRNLSSTAKTKMDNLKLAVRLYLIALIFSIDFLIVGIVYALGVDGNLGKDYFIPFALVGPAIGMTNTFLLSVIFDFTK
jgi:hypothetical protein